LLYVTVAALAAAALANKNDVRFMRWILNRRQDARQSPVLPLITVVVVGGSGGSAVGNEVPAVTRPSAAYGFADEVG
jgi:hypothetical protein